MSVSLKRRRVGVIQRSAKRPIDKELKAVQLAVTNAVASSTLKTTTFPGTVVSLRWSVRYVGTLATSNTQCYWAIVVVPDGEAVNTPGVSDGADFYTPEQNVIAFGILAGTDADVGQGPSITISEGSTKAMRKLKQGDVLSFICFSNTANSGDIRGVVQFFFKT